MNAFIPYGRQEITDDDVAAVVAALRAPMITQGPLIEAFEVALAERVGAKYAVTFNSGTAALHAAYFAAGIAPGKSVLTTPITFAATANASLYLGGGVHFVDIDAETGQIDVEQVRKRSDASIRVVAPVHFTGHVSDIEAIAAIAAERGWVVVEDAAHALGAQYTDSKGTQHRVGSCAHSAMCCFSFHPVKHVTTGEGGAVTTNDPVLHRKLQRFRTHGITRAPGELLHNEGDWYYEQQDLGFNYRLTDVQCALGVSQLARLDASVARRREIAGIYDCAFAGESAVRPLHTPPRSIGSYHLYVVRVPAGERRKRFDALRAAGIGVNVHYVPVYRHPYYRNHGFASTRLENAEAYYASAISLPMFPGLRNVDLERVIVEVSQRSTVTT